LWRGFGLEKRAGAAHIPFMTQETRTPLLEVVVINRSPQSWEWQVWSGDEILVVGFESTGIAANLLVTTPDSSRWQAGRMTPKRPKDADQIAKSISRQCTAAGSP
jgi:hypothetical protein